MEHRSEPRQAIFRDELRDCLRPMWALEDRAPNAASSWASQARLKDLSIVFDYRSAIRRVSA